MSEFFALTLGFTSVGATIWNAYAYGEEKERALPNSIRYAAGIFGLAAAAFLLHR